MIVEEDVENGYDSWNEMQSLHIPIPRDIHVSHQQTINTLATCLSLHPHIVAALSTALCILVVCYSFFARKSCNYVLE